MSDKRASQSININERKISNVQIGGIAGRDQTVTQTQQASIFGEILLTQTDVVDLIVQLEDIFRSSGLPDELAIKALKHLETAKQEVQAEKPDKEFAAKSLQRATRVLKEAGETVAAGSSLWQKVKPVMATLSSWFGVAAGFFI